MGNEKNWKRAWREKMIGIIDYGLGNVNAFLRMLNELNVETTLVKDRESLAKSSKLILPGVGEYDDAMEKIRSQPYFNDLHEDIIVRKKPILGVCIAMQIFGKKSEEGHKSGLSFVDFDVKKFSEKEGFRVPHMGWNSVSSNSDPIFKGINLDHGFYFLHSYIVDNLDEKYAISTCDYSENFVCGFKKENIYGFQFHPEKSHLNGTLLLKNFSEMQC